MPSLFSKKPKQKLDLSGGGSKLKPNKLPNQSDVVQERGRIDKDGVPRKIKTVAKKTTKPKKQKKNKVFIEG